MFESTPRKASPWLIASLILLFISTALYLFDQDRSDEELLSLIQQGIQADFEDCLNTAMNDADLPESFDCNICQLQYDTQGRLKSWTNSEFLPIYDEIDALNQLSRKSLLEIGTHTYYQIRRPGKNDTDVWLIPVRISFEIKNEFLDPYVFLGRWQDLPNKSRNKNLVRDMRSFVGEGNAPFQVRITDVQGKTVLSINKINLIPFRSNVRLAFMICLSLSVFFCLIYLRIYTLHNWSHRFRVNVGLAIGILLLRVVLYLLEVPGKYLDVPLFSPDILAFHFLAPSLGDLTINILTFTALVWILYTHLFRIGNIFYHRLMQHKGLAWGYMILAVALSSGLLYWYASVFEGITVNSQVDIEFSNIFKTNVYSYVILFDVSLLLLAVTMLMCTLLRFNVYFYRRFQGHLTFFLVHGVTLLGINYLLHPSVPLLAGLIVLVIIGVGVLIYRRPFRTILKQDLPNYLLLTALFSALITYHVTLGVQLSQRVKAQRIGARVLGSQSTSTVLNFTKALKRMEGEMDEIRAKHIAASDTNDFRDWINETFLQSNFKGFEVSLFLYDTTGRRLDDDPRIKPAFGPEQEFSPGERGGISLSSSHLLYQLPNPNAKNEYVDFYVGSFDLFLDADSTEKVQLQLELKPINREFRGLYPSLSMDQALYDDIKLITSFDHAVYREGVLYTKRGSSTFPLRMDDWDQYTGKTNRERGDYYEYLEPLAGQRLVIVRYPKETLLGVATTFSLIFYLLNLAGLVFVALPVLLMRSIRTNRITKPLPLRAKIRLGLLGISVLPMLVIMGLLYPFVSQRYQREARENLMEETIRVMGQIEPAYNKVRTDFLQRMTATRQFRERVRELDGLIDNDINVYDQNGVRLATTQPIITEAQIYTDLMNEFVLDSLQTGRVSDLVINERIGSLSYLSSYRPMLGKDGRIIGYVNVPYLARQDQLEDQVINFLSYLANIYLIVFLLLNVVAVGIASNLTKPLKLIQERLSTTKLGRDNSPISYQAKDEIGAIVEAYNGMVVQLENSQQKIAQNQREMAWQQMARQVAHEIKNPLTPMRLNIQHLMRAWKEQSPRLEKMFPKVMNSLMVQIDSLVRIANSFHEFAKMPEPVKSHISVNEVLLEVVDLYTQSEDAIWLIDIPQEPFWTYADRDQISRCFNNIIKNALQAIEENGIIHVSMRIFETKARVEIKDNGMGMPAEVQKKIFEPSFSTKNSGMGLGLAIVRRIIENAGGNISFRSQEGVGTTFFIELPRVERDPARVHGADSAPMGS